MDKTTEAERAYEKDAKQYSQIDVTFLIVGSGEADLASRITNLRMALFA